MSASGILFNFVAPGVGAILQAIGRQVADGEGDVIFNAGPKDVLYGNTDAFCKYMADP